ncbi:uncharacterized protein NPIL_44011 [Nephila pilipes]|uniref:Uncharacterized protein n=1 Tax=Nephila pilipes TaxID=299642 RepID=A0A8X6MHY6_NEPPI|nr:uncharacterized protein NPIL_44011 [Nephila pilipes]
MAGDGVVLRNLPPLGLGPQPLKKQESPKSSEDGMKYELQLNRSRLALTRKLMKNIKDEINECSGILRREMGKDVDISALVRSGGGMGFQNRASEIMNLRMKLTALKSQFLEPVHKPYYRGPFDPRKKFDLKLLPEKQDNLYCQVLVEEKKALLKQGKPVETLKNQLKELSLMYRASCYRNKSLKKSIHSVNVKLQVLKGQTQDNAKVIEYMISHQNLMKLMLNPDTLRLDSSVPRAYEKFQIVEKKVEVASDFAKYKTLCERSEKESQTAREKVTSLAEILDATVGDLVKAEATNTENRCDLEFLKNPPQKATAKSKAKKKSPKAAEKDDKSKVELDLLVQENRHLRDFLLSPVLSNGEDLKLFLLTLKNAKEEFLRAFEETKKDIGYR